MKSAVSGPTDWILRFIKTLFYHFYLYRGIMKVRLAVTSRKQRIKSVDPDMSHNMSSLSLYFLSCSSRNIFYYTSYIVFVEICQSDLRLRKDAL